MKIHEISGKIIISIEIHEILCFQPSATLHETFIFLRKKQGLRSLALRGAPKTEIWVKFQEFHEISWNFIKIHELPWISRKIMFWDARERIWALQPLKKHRNYLPFCTSALYGRFLVNSRKFIEKQEIQWKCKNSMKIIKNHEIQWFSGSRDPPRNLCFPCSKSRSERLGPPKT